MSEIIETTNEIEIRGLKATDLGAVCKIISAIGIREFKSCFDAEHLQSVVSENNSDATAVGMSMIFDIAGIIISNIPKAESEIQSFIASLTGLKLADVKEMAFADYGEVIMKIVMKDDFRDFFGRAIKLFK